MTVVPPPVPAPYLDAVPPLSETVLKLLSEQRALTSRERRLVNRELKDRRQRLAQARREYELQHGVRIAPEIPTAD